MAYKGVMNIPPPHWKTKKYRKISPTTWAPTPSGRAKIDRAAKKAVRNREHRQMNRDGF